ncbi:MAG TPA: S41 family peptidase [Candidatus Acidoferrum sp.]|nr:S41 family peptidase [Candidatus Acidoferrum sp.]
MTRQFPCLFILALTGWLAAPGILRADATNPAPDFKEVYELLLTNLPGATDASLNRAAVAGLIAQFPGQIELVSEGTTGTAPGSGEKALSRSAIIENNVVYWRVDRVTTGLAAELADTGRTLTASNTIAGAVLDLRFAGGEDYGASQAVAALLSDQRASRPIGGPLVVLVNGGTHGAAETLAAALRSAGTGLILGNTTAGSTLVFKPFVLKDGERLLIATTPAKPDGKINPTESLKPDITVNVAAEEERAFWRNPYVTKKPTGDAARAVTNSFLPFVDRTSEADLVRQKQKDAKSNGLPASMRPVKVPARSADDDSDVSPAATVADLPPKPQLRDPVLVRAVDLVKGLAALRGPRP